MVTAASSPASSTEPAPAAAMNAPPLQYRLLKRLYQGRCSTVSRVLLPGRDAPVIVKQLDRGRCAPGAPARLQHEFELLGTLELEGIPQALEQLEFERGPALVFADREAHSLRQAMRPGNLGGRSFGPACRQKQERRFFAEAALIQRQDLGIIDAQHTHGGGRIVVAAHVGKDARLGIAVSRERGIAIQVIGRQVQHHRGSAAQRRSGL